MSIDEDYCEVISFFIGGEHFFLLFNNTVMFSFTLAQKITREKAFLSSLPDR